MCACHSELKLDDSNPHFLAIWKRPHSTAAVQEQQQQQQSQRCNLFNLRHPRDFKSTNIPKGKIVYIYVCYTKYTIFLVYYDNMNCKIYSSINVLILNVCQLGSVWYGCCMAHTCIVCYAHRTGDHDPDLSRQQYSFLEYIICKIPIEIMFAGWDLYDMTVAWYINIWHVAHTDRSDPQIIIRIFGSMSGIRMNTSAQTCARTWE